MVRTGWTRCLNATQNPPKTRYATWEHQPASRGALAPEAARYILSLEFEQFDLKRMYELAEKARDGALWLAEAGAVENYRHVGRRLALLRSNARFPEAAGNPAAFRSVWTRLQRARGVCEYCRMPQDFDGMPLQIDHIIASKYGARLRKTTWRWHASTQHQQRAKRRRCRSGKTPNGIIVQQGDLSPEHISIQESIPVTVIDRTIADLPQSGGRIGLLKKAVSGAHREGYIAGAHAARLRHRIKTGAPSVGGSSRNER